MFKYQFYIVVESFKVIGIIPIRTALRFVPRGNQHFGDFAYD